LNDFFRTVGSFLLYTAATIIIVKYFDNAYKFIDKWGLPVAVICILVAFFLLKKSPVNPVRK
jgi:hypothetical protein